jgi:hypothetical protein
MWDGNPATRAIYSYNKLRNEPLGQLKRGDQGTLQRVPASILYTSQPNPGSHGNPPNCSNNPAWTSTNWLVTRHHFTTERWYGCPVFLHPPPAPCCASSVSLSLFVSLCLAPPVQTVLSFPLHASLICLPFDALLCALILQLSLRYHPLFASLSMRCCALLSCSSRSVTTLYSPSHTQKEGRLNQLWSGLCAQ